MLALSGVALLAMAACGSSEPTAAAGGTGSGPADATATFDDAALEALGGQENAEFLDGLYQQAVDAGQTTITVYGVTATSSASLYEAFSARYPEITVDHVTIFGAELQNRVASEQTTGQYVADNVSVSGADAVYLTDNDYLAEQQPLLAADLPEEYKPAGDTLFGGNTYLYTLSYNTDEVSADEVPTSFEELLDPKWKGRIGMGDPAAGATGFVAAAIHDGKLEESWLDEFKANEPVILPSERDVFTAVSTGQIALGLGNYIRGEAFLAVDDLPVGFVAKFEDGVSDGVFYRGTVKNAPNAIASDLLTSWWLTPEAQTLIAAQGQPGLMPGAPAVPGQPPLSEITVNPSPPFAEYADYSTWAMDLFKKVFTG
ncbi:ABC transporter substrate-binding protein [Nakamurella leprariae]|uniref:Extracellular solute-binding protein n=1 Tax=Nakamurella leprariae TaxID=2803911 RepID=A0A938YAG9_9ACTN|nr:extracellular solute-binding protein [Nakamurella leprariae]MBM9466997.1 extracellular solute-binding protein [Nakamurella leprariae]